MLDSTSRGGRSSAGRAPGCGPGGRGFESHRSPLSGRPPQGDPAPSKSWIDRFALEGEHAEHALVHAPERLAADEALERLDAQRELTHAERALPSEPTLAQAGEILGLGVSGPVDDPEVLTPPGLEGGLDEAAASEGDLVEPFYDHALAASFRQVGPPDSAGVLAFLVGCVHDGVGGPIHELIGRGQVGERFHVPKMGFVGVNRSVAREQVERRELDVVDALDGPAVAPVRVDEPAGIFGALLEGLEQRTHIDPRGRRGLQHGHGLTEPGLRRSTDRGVLLA